MFKSFTSASESIRFPFISILLLGRAIADILHCNPSAFSTQRWLGVVGQDVGSSRVAGSSGRRSHPLFLCPSPALLHIVPSALLCHAMTYARETTTAGVRGTITKYITTINGTTATYHFYEMDVSAVDGEWLENKQRRREWVDYGEAIRRVQWKPELAQALMLSSLAPPPATRR